MKTAFKISLLANLVLGAAVLYQAAIPPAPAAASRTASELPSNLIATRSPKPALTGRFDWGQVEASDYATYISNLRSIRCPEQTIRDIIKADVANLFDTKRKEL